MNIAYFLLPKLEVVYLRNTMTILEGLEKMKHSGFTALPVIDKKERYVGVISEGDFLWNILQKEEDFGEISVKTLDGMIIKDILQKNKRNIKAVCIDTDMEELLEQAQNQNFVPVIDDRSVFIGIITRKDIIRYFAGKKSIMKNTKEG